MFHRAPPLPGTAHRGWTPIVECESLFGIRITGMVRASISRFSKGTQEAAFAGGAAPITLIDGDKLIDLLIQHGIGVRKKTVEVLEVVAEDFAMAEEGE